MNRDSVVLILAAGLIMFLFGYVLPTYGHADAKYDKACVAMGGHPHHIRNDNLCLSPTAELKVPPQ